MNSSPDSFTPRITEDCVSNFDLASLFDLPAVQSLMDDFYLLTKIPMALLDIKGNVLVRVGWREICARFHRIHPETKKHCLESDTLQTANVPPGEFNLYKCKNNMWDISTPLYLDGSHVGNLFAGQFFFEDEDIDFDLFRRQAQRYGFDEREYLNALADVPRLSRENIEIGMRFFTKLTQFLSEIGFNRLRDMAERKQAELHHSIELAISNILTRVPTVAEAIPQILKEISSAFGWSVGAVWWEDPQKKTLRVIHDWYRDGFDVDSFIKAGRELSFIPGEGLPGRTWVAQEATWIEDISADDSFPRKAEALRYSLCSVFAFPILLAGRSVGVMEFYSTVSRIPDPAFLQFMDSLGSQIGQHIERKHAEVSLRESERRFRATLQNIRLIAIELDHNGKVLFCNDFTLEITGWEREVVIGHNWFENFVPDGSALLARYRQWIKTNTMPHYFENEVLTRSGEPRLVSWSITVLYDSTSHNMIGVAVIGEDITERRRYEEELHYMGTHDALTGLFNRAFYDAELERLKESRRYPVSVIVADIDGLKKINDTLGHAAGDLLIQQAAKILRCAVRPEDVVARLGGDEFTILLPQTGNTDDAITRIRQSCETVQFEGKELRLRLSLGAATAETSAELKDAMLRADARMYADKNSKKQQPN